MGKKQGERVGLLSRLEFGSPGFRQGLLKEAFEVFAREEVGFIVIGGGLVAFPHLRKQLTTTALDDLWDVLYGKSYSYQQKPPRKDRCAAAREHLLNTWAQELAKAIPQLRPGRNYVKIYIVTSPAPNFDSWVGAEVARRLTKLRPDILFWGERSARFTLKSAKTFCVLTPEKLAWRSLYFSTAVDRLIEDEITQSSQKSPDLWVVGCTASALHRPAGENPKPYVSLLAVHKLQNVHTSENQVGARVVEFAGDGILVRTYNFKDLVADEGQYIPTPAEATDLQQKIVGALRQGPMTIGMLEDKLRTKRGKITGEIEILNESGFKPVIVLDPSSQLYDFDQNWIQRELRYPTIKFDALDEDTVLGFGCLHAGSVFVQYQWFVETLPQLILERGVTTLAGAGDLIEGLAHSLMERGEVMAGLNYTQQERLAARLIAAVILKVFEGRLVTEPGADMSDVRNALIRFLYIEGNHEEWERKMGVEPLVVFRAALIDRVSEGIAEILKDRGLLSPTDLRKIVGEKMVYGNSHELDSGLRIALRHPYMSRTKTTSLRTQHTLGSTSEQIVVIANFHVATCVEQWAPETGQRVGLQVGTILSESTYENGKGKVDDTVVGVVRVLSDEGRILMSEVFWHGLLPKERDEKHGNDALLEAFARSIGI